MPITVPGTSDDLGSDRQLPRTAANQYAASPGGWMDLEPGPLAALARDLGGFSTGVALT